MHNMNSQEYRDFLLSVPRTAKIATIRGDGRPHVAPVWFDLDNEMFVFTTWHTTVKAANLLHDPRVSICVDDDKPPFAFVIADCVASFDQDTGHLDYWARRIAGRYMGPDLADSYGKRNSVEGELLVRLTPIKIIAKKGISD